MTTAERREVVRAYVGDRSNRRHKPGRALERLGYRFDVLADYGAFRDLQRHRMLTIEWQTLSPRHGYTRPEAVDLAGELQPRLTVPSHYDMFAHNSADPKLFADYMDVKYPERRYWIGGYGERVDLPPLDAGDTTTR